MTLPFSFFGLCTGRVTMVITGFILVNSVFLKKEVVHTEGKTFDVSL